jgi:ATP-binding cassette subfamily B protein
MAITTIAPKQQLSYDMKQTVTENRFQGLWRLMKGYRLQYLGAAISLGLATIARTSTFLLLAYFVDKYLGEGERQYGLMLIVFGFIGLAVVQGVFTFASGRLAASTSEGITQRVRDYLHDQIQRLSFTYHDNNQTGELIQRATSDVDALRRFFAEQAIESGRILMLFVVNFTAIFLISWQLALISVIVIPLVLVMSVFFFKKVSTRYEAYQEQEAVLSSTLEQNLSGVRVVKAFARQEYEEEKFQAVNQEKYRLGRRLLWMHSLYWPISDTLCGFQMVLGFAVGAMMAINGTITVGTYMAYSGMIIWLIWPIRNLGRLIIQMSTGLVSFKRVSKVVAEEREADRVQ